MTRRLTVSWRAETTNHARAGRPAGLTVAVVLSVLATACSSTQYAVQPPDVSVDAPEVREIKARIGMDDCRPGTGSDPVQGGLPDMTLPCLGGGPDVKLSTLRGPMVVNAWAHWCPPCREEMPVLQEFREAHGDRVPILGLNLNDLQPVKAMQLADRSGVTYPSVADPGGEVYAQAQFAIVKRGMPAFLFIAEDGTIAGTASGGIDTVADLERLVSKYLEVDLES